MRMHLCLQLTMPKKTVTPKPAAEPRQSPRTVSLVALGPAPLVRVSAAIPPSTNVAATAAASVVAAPDPLAPRITNLRRDAAAAVVRVVTAASRLGKIVKLVQEVGSAEADEEVAAETKIVNNLKLTVESLQQELNSLLAVPPRAVAPLPTPLLAPPPKVTVSEAGRSKTPTSVPVSPKAFKPEITAPQLAEAWP